MNLFEELSQLPEALLHLADAYQTGDGQELLRLPAPVRPVLVGMGASYHAAWIGSLMLRRAGIYCLHEEAGDALNYQPLLLRQSAPLVYISQSGSSGEVQPLVEQLPDPSMLVAITNQPESPLARRAGLLLPMTAGEETLIASKTYVNTLALLWLIAQRWSQADMPSSFDAVRRLADRADAIRREREQPIARLEAVFAAAKRVVFLGHGPHAASARQAAMTLSEWPKLACHSYGIGAYRHGFIETIDPSVAVILFTPPGKTRASAVALGKELAGYGAAVQRIENGQVLGLDEPAEQANPVDEYLSPILDMLPIQWFAEAAARKRLDVPGFRYLTKVVSKL